MQKGRLPPANHIDNFCKQSNQPHAATTIASTIAIILFNRPDMCAMKPAGNIFIPSLNFPSPSPQNPPVVQILQSIWNRIHDPEDSADAIFCHHLLSASPISWAFSSPQQTSQCFYFCRFPGPRYLSRYVPREKRCSSLIIEERVWPFKQSLVAYYEAA